MYLYNNNTSQEFNINHMTLIRRITYTMENSETISMSMLNKLKFLI